MTDEQRRALHELLDAAIEVMSYSEPAEPAPAEPAPAELAPAEPAPAEPAPAELAPAEPAPAEPVHTDNFGIAKTPPDSP